MTIAQHRRRALLSGLFVCTLVVSCGVLAVLQYRWIGEVSVAARERLRGGLQATLMRLSQGLNSDVAAACSGLVSPNNQVDPQELRRDMAARYAQWTRGARNPGLVHSLGVAVPQKQSLELLLFDPPHGTLEEASWPAAWNGLRERLEARIAPDQREGHNPPAPMEPASGREDLLVELPLFPPNPPNNPPFGRREIGWMIVEFSPDYFRDTLLPEIVQRYLSAGGTLDYQVQIVSRGSLKSVIYQSDPRMSPIPGSADASAVLFDPPQILWQGNGGGGGRGGGRGPGRGPGPDDGRWQILVRHRAGSLEAVVAQARWRNLAIAAGFLLLIMATSAALIRFTRRTERLAELQMDFVAGVSHELRTPLTVIHTAAYNLQGKLAADPAQVERYGALIQRESARLTGMVEQILRFASAESGRIVQQREPLSIESVIEEAVAANRALLESSHCLLEQNIAPNLPPVLGDRVALRNAVENLVTNAAKYGLQGGNWIGIFAERTPAAPESVEIRVSDHGPGIPVEEREQIFDPFFRGARAKEDQIHGTGLGLSLVKKIVEAHGGDVRVESEPAKGTAFILRLPAAAGAGG